MQTCGGGGGGAVDLGVYRLIAFSVGQLLLDIGRQGHLAQALQHLQEDALIMEPDQLIARIQGVHNRGRQGAISKGQLRTGLGLSARFGQAFPDAVSLVLEQKNLHGPHPVAQKACRQHTGVVEYQAVSGIQQIQNVIKMPVTDVPGSPIQGHEPGSVPLLQRCLGNQLLRQIIVKIMSFQAILSLKQPCGVGISQQRTCSIQKQNLIHSVPGNKI